MMARQGFIGKTVARLESPVPGRYGRDDGTVLVHFTDGTALEIAGSSHEEVSQSVELLDPEAVRKRQREAQGWREQHRLTRLKRREWMAISCEERVARRAKRSGDLIGTVFERLLLTDMIRDVNAPFALGLGPSPERSYRLPCEQCGETQCPNAPVETRPAHPGFSGIASEPIFVVYDGDEPPLKD